MIVYESLRERDINCEINVYENVNDFKDLYGYETNYFKRIFITDSLMKIIVKGKYEDGYFYVSTSKEELLKQLKKDKIETL